MVLIGSLTEEEEALSARYGVLPLSRAVGCKRCGNSGYKGRLPLVEVAVITPALADMIAGGASAHALQRAAVAQGMAPLREVAVARVRRGETTLQEIERVVGDSVEEDKKKSKDGAPPAILVVNADPAWRRMARALLEGGGFKVTEAVDAQQAMQLQASGEEFALMVTDMMLPTLNAPAARPALRPTTAVRALPENVPDPAGAAEQGGSQGVDWARFAQTVQSSLRKNEH